LQLTLGAIIDGELTGKGERHEHVAPGIQVGLQLNKRWIDERDWVPYLTTTFGFALGWVRNRQTRSPDIQGNMQQHAVNPELVDADGELVDIVALDARFGLMVGYTFWRVWSPYIAARTFGAPMFWEHNGKSVCGVDRYHFQAAIGSSIFVGDSGMALFVDWSPFFERSVSAGAGLAF
jgi:hypothetical protein